jgi:tRNA(Ile)-lysidine synthase TilS/MesJ
MLEAILVNQCGLDPARPVLAGVSGGPDSLCLLGILQEAGYRVIMAHFNHQLRPEADLEANAVSELALRQGLPFVTDGADVREYANLSRWKRLHASCGTISCLQQHGNRLRRLSRSVIRLTTRSKPC